MKLTADTAYGVACDLLGMIAKSAEEALPEAIDAALPVSETIDVVGSSRPAPC